jgi:hypothetical protein
MCKCVVFKFISTARPAATTPPPPLGWGYLTQHRDTQFKTILPIFDILT